MAHSLWANSRARWRDLIQMKRFDSLCFITWKYQKSRLSIQVSQTFSIQINSKRSWNEPYFRNFPYRAIKRDNRGTVNNNRFRDPRTASNCSEIFNVLLVLVRSEISKIVSVLVWTGPRFLKFFRFWSVDTCLTCRKDAKSYELIISERSP